MRTRIKILLLVSMLSVAAYLAAIKFSLLCPTIPLLQSDLTEKYIETDRGSIAYALLEKEVYNKFDYQTVRYGEPFATLRRKHQQTCGQVFSDWLAVATSSKTDVDPPKKIPPEIEDKFTMYHYAYVKKKYFNNHPLKYSTIYWPQSVIDQMANESKVYCKTFPDVGETVYYATKVYNVTDLYGLIVGSISPWVEAFCIRNGAANLVTVEYKKVVTDHPKLFYQHPVEFAQNWTTYVDQFDFAISFSSIEHSGLGRFGDSIDPIGDLREVQKVRCLLKDGGLLYFGCPIGVDAVIFNAYRIYGRLRLPMLFEGFELLDVFYSKNEKAINLTASIFDKKSHNQYLFVLKKRNQW